MKPEEVEAEILRLMQEARQYHEQGKHLLSLQTYKEAMNYLPQAKGWTLLLLLRTAGEYHDCDNYERAVELLVVALSIAPDTQEEDDLLLRAQIKKQVAITFRSIYGPQRPDVLALLEEARSEFAARGRGISEANVIQHLGGCYIELGRLPEADGLFQEAMRKAIAANDLQLQAWLLDNMADLEIERDDWGQALDYTCKARTYAQKLQDRECEGDTWITEARIQFHMDNLSEALTAAQHALELYTSNSNKRRTVRARRYVARTLVKLEREEEAFQMLQEALKTANELMLYHDQAGLHLELGEREMARKNFGLACQHAATARRLADEEDLEGIVAEADELLAQSRREEK